MHAAIFFFFLPLFSLYSGILAQPHNDQYDHHWFVITWPNGFCSGNICGSVPQNLVLHGLWPAYSTGVIPTVCRLNPIKDIWPLIRRIPQQLRNDMDRLWASIGNYGSNEAFWVHQWEQHGTCQIKQPYIYFDTVIQLRERIDLDSVIKAEVQPGESASRDDFIRAITVKLGDVNPVFRCVDSNGNKLLSEIIICIDKLGDKVISCNAELPHDNCGPTIQFPAQPE